MFITATIISISACAIAALVWNHYDKTHPQNEPKVIAEYDYSEKKAA